MPKGIPLTEKGKNRRRREILDAAMRLIVEKGFLEVSMREIAEAAGVGKSTLYDYFPFKDEILIAYIVEEVHHNEAAAVEIMAMDLSASEKLRLILRKHLDSMQARWS